MRNVGSTPKPTDNEISEKIEVGFEKKEHWVRGTNEEREDQALEIKKAESAAVIDLIREDVIQLIREEMNK